MSPKFAGRMAAILSLALTALGALALASAAALSGCALGSPATSAHVDPEWRLVPEGTALSQRRQFFLYGRNLDSARLSAPPSVKVEKLEARKGGRALTLYLTVGALVKDSLAKGEAAGSREIRVETPDTSLVLRLNVVDEAFDRR
jgi:hypothetical protein